MSLAWLPVTKPIATAKFQVVEPSCDCIFKKIRQIPQSATVLDYFVIQI